MCRILLSGSPRSRSPVGHGATCSSPSSPSTPGTHRHGRPGVVGARSALHSVRHHDRSMIPGIRLTAPVLGTPDPPGLARFYQQLLGWPIRDDEPEWATL